MLLNKVVIGSSVEAAFFALVNESFFISTRKTPPLFYKSVEVPLFGLSSDSKVWSRLNFVLGLLSKRICFNELNSIRITDDEVKISTENVNFKYFFEKLYIFETSGLQVDNEITKTSPKTFRVIDDFELSVLGPKRKHLEPITGGTGLAGELHFYCSDRVDGSDYVTDCVMESELTLDQLNSFDFSDSMARFVVERHLTSIGVNGSFMKYYNNGSPKYRKPKVTHVKRLSFELDNNTYEDTDKIKFMNLKLEQIIEKST